MTRSRTKNQRKRKRKRKRQQQKKKNQLIPIPDDHPGLYAVQDGGFTMPDIHSARPQLPLSRRESDLLFTLKSTRDGIGPRCIYKVRAYRDDNAKWHYEGRGFNSLVAYPLHGGWLTRNNMPPIWRQKTICNHPKYWFKCRVLSTQDDMQLTGCIPSAIFKFYNHVGMLNHARELFRRWREGLTSWGACINFIQRAKGFTFDRRNCQDLTENLLVLGQQKCLFLIQISAISLSMREFDNLHAIGVYHGLIFDVNHKHPLPLTQENLDECCLGGTDWVFHHVSRVRQVIPTPTTAAKIENFMSKRFSE